MPDLGHLEGTNERDIKQGTTLELPYWLGISLAAVPDRDYISIALPKPYTSRVRNALAAFAKSVNLRNLGGAGGWFFACGVRLEESWVSPTQDSRSGRKLTRLAPHSIDDPRLKEVLYKAFRARLPEIMDQSQHASQHSTVGGRKGTSGVGQVDQQAEMFLTGMDEWEKERESPNWAATPSHIILIDSLLQCSQPARTAREL